MKQMRWQTNWIWHYDGPRGLDGFARFEDRSGYIYDHQGD